MNANILSVTKDIIKSRFPMIVKLHNTYKTTISSYRKTMSDILLNLCTMLLPNGFYVQMMPYGIIDKINNLERDIESYNTLEGKKNVRDTNRVLTIRLLLKLVESFDSGHYAELGTHRGHCAKLIWNNMNSNAKLYCFDSFEGFSEFDVDIEKTTLGTQAAVGHLSDTSVEIAVRNILGVGQESNRLIMLKGYFPKTFEGLANIPWRFINLDFDLYEPTREALELMWPQLVHGGIVLIHDYNNPKYLGVKKATDEFFIKHCIVPIPLNDYAGSALVIKSLAK
ncbi:MAG: hypothetical protein FD174_992 [Geobacteraceae bacterium]|nr:MAG: hypothetical protein FD174_992 [Geobacteraceae bacterium]